MSSLSPADILKQYFGYESFRGAQEALVEAILAGSDVLGVMPTGAGKSVCFQVPSLIMEGLTLVISPLISLMKDQVHALTQAGISSAFVNSSLNAAELAHIMARARQGDYKLLYVAPERLFAPSFLEFACSARVSMIAVDEAHCISQWGQDFRPSYARIPEFAALLPVRPVISAFTATATPQVRTDIVVQLHLLKPAVFITGFDRPNLYFEVQKPKDKFAALCAFLRDRKNQNGIVYCATRSAVEEVSEKLNGAGFRARRYHAGLSDEERKASQDDFLYDRFPVMVATNAFGMGIDKSNVAFVVHYHMPKDIESYYQEAGRAGRDGQNASCLLLYSGQDVRTQQWLIDNAQETESADPQTAETVRERSRQRLKQMTFYSTTQRCLRSFILAYFGEQPSPRCGKCGNCDTQYETADVTIEAQKILSCVYRMKESYGVTMVIDVLRGSKAEKLRNAGLDKLSTYGICSESASRLRSIIEQLVAQDFLVKTDTDYPLLKLGKRAAAVLRKEENVVIELVKERAPEAGGVQGKAAAGDFPAAGDKALFEKLRGLRAAIAAEQGVPAYIVFSDNTLRLMCVSKPSGAEALLRVPGVGQVKLERYGEQFLRVIAAHVCADD